MDNRSGRYVSIRRPRWRSEPGGRGYTRPRLYRLDLPASVAPAGNEDGRGAAERSAAPRSIARLASAADLKFLRQLQQIRLGTSNRKGALES